MPSSTRRHLLRAAGFALVAGVAGCSSEDGPEPGSASPSPTRTATATWTSTATATRTSTADDAAPHLGAFVLWNDDDTPHTLSLTVRRDDAHVLTITRELDPGRSTRVANPIERQGVYRLTASLETNRRRRIRWPVESCANAEYCQCYVAGDGTLGLRILRRTVDPAPTCE